MASVFLWTSAENAIGLVAASLPPLHKLYSFYGGSLPREGLWAVHHHGNGNGNDPPIMISRGGREIASANGNNNNNYGGGRPGAGATETIGGTPLSNADDAGDHHDNGHGSRNATLAVAAPGGPPGSRAQSRAGSSRSGRHRHRRRHSDTESLGSLAGSLGDGDCGGRGRWHELDNRGSSRENIVRAETCSG